VIADSRVYDGILVIVDFLTFGLAFKSRVVSLEKRR
jgi:hypothetical protein